MLSVFDFQVEGGGRVKQHGVRFASLLSTALPTSSGPSSPLGREGGAWGLSEYVVLGGTEGIPWGQE